MDSVFIGFFMMIGVAAALGFIGCIAGLKSDAMWNVCCGAGLVILCVAVYLLGANIEKLGIADVPKEVEQIQIYSLTPPLKEEIGENGETLLVQGDPNLFYYALQEHLNTRYYCIRIKNATGELEVRKFIDRKTTIHYLEDKTVEPYCVIEENMHGNTAKVDIYVPADSVMIKED